VEAAAGPSTFDVLLSQVRSLRTERDEARAQLAQVYADLQEVLG
jgi:uncharacterized coiled-coil DUF342 family protein